MLGVLGGWVAWSDQPLSRWTRDLTHGRAQGRDVVMLLRDGGPRSAAGELRVADLLLDRQAPFQRLPQAALGHALAAVEGAPGDERALSTLVRVYVETLQLEQAENLAATLLDERGQPTQLGRIVSDWVRQKRRQWRAELRD
jgi:hypothetical protein